MDAVQGHRIIFERDSVDLVLLEESYSPGHLSDEVVSELLSNPDFRELGHGALKLVSDIFPGVSPEAKSGYEGVLIGVALTIDVLRIQNKVV
jgi:hypothetical protein